MRHPRTTLVLLTTALALLISACGNDSSPSTGSGAPSPAAVVDGISTEHNDADVTLISDMTPHHEGAVAMAGLVATRAASTEVKDLGQRILAAQQPELDQMAAMARVWGVSLSDGGHDGGMGMDDDVAALSPLTGAAFDEEFLTRMTAHHEDALPMAQADLDKGQNPQAEALAQRIVTAQTAEIAEMKALLAAL